MKGDEGKDMTQRVETCTERLNDKLELRQSAAARAERSAPETAASQSEQRSAFILEVADSRAACGVVIHKGEFITCEVGHLICEVTVDIDSADEARGLKLGAWRPNLTPPRADEVQRCECGARFTRRTRDHRTQHHIEGRGWV